MFTFNEAKGGKRDKDGGPRGEGMKNCSADLRSALFYSPAAPQHIAAPPCRRLSASPITIRGLHVQTSPVSALCALPPSPPSERARKFYFFETLQYNPKRPCLPRWRGRCRRATYFRCNNNVKTRRRMRWNPTAAHRCRQSKTTPFARSRTECGATGAVAPSFCASVARGATVTEP